MSDSVLLFWSHLCAAAAAGGGGAAPPAVASIPSASSAFTPAGPSLSPQPPFPLRSSGLAPPPAATAARPGSGGSSPSAFARPPSARSPNASFPPRVPPAPAPAPAPHPDVPQPSVYNTPINLYSNVNATEVVMGQRRGLPEQQSNG